MRRHGGLRIMLILAGTAGLALALYLVAKPPEPTRSYQPTLPEEVLIALEGKSMITSTEDGRIVWSMRAEAIDYFFGKKMVAVESPRAWIPVEDGGTVEVAGKTGHYYQDSEDITIEGAVTALFDREGRREWLLTGDTASYRREEEAFYVGGLDGDVFPASGDTMEISGALGRYDVEARKMRVTGDAACSFVNGVSLLAEEINYDLDSETASSESEVRLTGGIWNLRGMGMRADLKKREVVVGGSVNVRIDRSRGNGQ